jgi:hypothetical protein
MGFPAGCFDLRDERRQFVGRAPRHASDKAFTREASSNGAAGRIARADHEAHAFGGNLFHLNYP